MTDKLFVILDCFLPFNPPNSPKNQNFEKLKKNLEILSFYTRVPKIMIICYTVPEIWRMSFFFFFFPFWAIFCPFTLPNSPKNQNFKKMKKIPGDTIIFQWCNNNHDHAILFLRCVFSFWATFCPFIPPSLPHPLKA